MARPRRDACEQPSMLLGPAQRLQSSVRRHRVTQLETPLRHHANPRMVGAHCDGRRKIDCSMAGLLAWRMALTLNGGCKWLGRNAPSVVVLSNRFDLEAPAAAKHLHDFRRHLLNPVDLGCSAMPRSRSAGSEITCRSIRSKGGGPPSHQTWRPGGTGTYAGFRSYTIRLPELSFSSFLNLNGASCQLDRRSALLHPCGRSALA